MDNKENCANLYFIIIIHVPSFVFERISVALLDIRKMDIDKEASKSIKKSHRHSTSEASMIKLLRKSPATLSAVEISNI